MTIIIWVLVGFVIGIILAVLSIFGFVAKYGFPNIFPSSGKPEAMAKSLVGMMVSSSQFLVGIFVIAVIALLIIGKSIEANAGVPIISAVVGYLLGRTYEAFKYQKTEEKKD